MTREAMSSNSETLFDLLYEVLSNKRIAKRMLEEENKTRKENMWYSTITEENLMRKVS